MFLYNAMLHNIKKQVNLSLGVQLQVILVQGETKNGPNVTCGPGSPVGPEGPGPPVSPLAPVGPSSP